VIADLSRIVDDSTARLDRMSHQEIADTFLRMGAITRRFLAAVNYRGNPDLPLFPRYRTSASTSRSHTALCSSSQPPFPAAFYPARPPMHPPFRMSPLGGLLSEVLCLRVHPHLHQHWFLPRPTPLLFTQVLTTTL
jgi:hypothetical protein